MSTMWRRRGQLPGSRGCFTPRRGSRRGRADRAQMTKEEAIALQAPSTRSWPCYMYVPCRAIGNTDPKLQYRPARGRHERSQVPGRLEAAAARSIRVQHGILSALDYLIGEKLMTYADTAVTRPEFARELPRFVAEVRNIFSGEEIRQYLDHLERMAAIEDEQAADENHDDDFSAEQRAANRARFAQLRELLTSTVLGTG